MSKSCQLCLIAYQVLGLDPALVLAEIGHKGDGDPLALVGLDCQVDCVDQESEPDKATNEHCTEQAGDGPADHSQHKGLDSMVFDPIEGR